MLLKQHHSLFAYFCTIHNIYSKTDEILTNTTYSNTAAFKCSELQLMAWQGNTQLDGTRSHCVLNLLPTGIDSEFIIHKEMMNSHVDCYPVMSIYKHFHCID